MAQLCKSVDHHYFGTPLSAKEAGSVETSQLCDCEAKKSKTKQAEQLEAGEGMLNDGYKAMPSRSESSTKTAGVPEQSQIGQVASDGECAAGRGENAADMGEHAVGRGDHTVDGEQAAWCCIDHGCRHKHTSQLSEASNLPPEKVEMKYCISSELVLNNLDQQTSEVFLLDEHTSLNSLTFSDKQLQIQAGAEQRRDHGQDGVIPHDPCPTDLLIDFSNQQPWMNLNMNISQTSQTDLHLHHDSKEEGLGLHEKDMCLEEKLMNSEIESESLKTGSSEFDMIDEEYIDKLIGKLENPQPDCWLQRSSSCKMQSPSLLDTDVPSYQEIGSLSLSHPEDCVLNSENPRLGMTPSTLLPELPQEQVPHVQGMIVPDVISTHESGTLEHHYFSSPVLVHHFSNVINTEVQEDESCPKEFLVSVAEPFWTESAMNIPPQQGMQNEIYPNISEEEEESSFSLVQEAEKPLLLSVEAEEKSLSSAPVEDILANPQRNDVNDMELGSDDKKERHDDEDRMRRINSSSESGDCGTQISICKQTSDQQFMLNLKEEENMGTRSKPRDDSFLTKDERQPSTEDEVEVSNGSTQSCDCASQTTVTQLDWEQFKNHERKSEDYEWSSDDNGSMQSEHGDCSSEDDNNTGPLQESATDTASEDQLSYFFSYDDDEMPTNVCPPKSIVSVGSFSVTESSNMASLKHSCDEESEGRMADIKNSSSCFTTSDEDYDYHLQNSTGLTENSLVQRHKGTARRKPMLKLKLHLQDKRTKNGLLLRDKNCSPEEQHKEKDIGSENTVVSRHTVTDDLQQHSKSSFAGEQNSQKAITRRVEQLIPVKVLLCRQPASSTIPSSQPLCVNTQSSKLSTGCTQTLLSSTIVNKTRSPCHRHAEEQSEKRQEKNIGKAHEDDRENYCLKGQVNVGEKENKWNVGESVKAQQEKKNFWGYCDDGHAENMNLDNSFDKVEKEKKLSSNGKEIGDINKNNIYEEKGFDNEKNIRKLGSHHDTDNDDEENQKESGDKQNSDDERDEEKEQEELRYDQNSDSEKEEESLTKARDNQYTDDERDDEEEQKESGDKQNSDDERDEEKEQEELRDDQNSDSEKEEERLTKARDNQYTDDKDSDLQQREVREDHNSECEEKEYKEEIGDGAEDRTVCVTGFTAGDEELCQLYFENTKRSGGGDIAEPGCVWDDMANRFLITFVDRQAVHRVLERRHDLANRDVQVKQYVPPPCFKDTVLVTGIPQGTSADCLQNFLESVADMALDIVQMNEAEGKAIVFLADGEAGLNDVKHLQQACQKNPLYGHSVLSVQRIPLSHTVFVENLNPKTKESAILYFFSNKNRNSGGPVTYTKRLNSTSAIVHFENHRDAQAVVDKGSHILDDFPLKVSLHLECFPLTAEVMKEGANYCSSLLTGGVPAIHKNLDYDDQTQEEQHYLASEEIHQYDRDASPFEVTQKDHVAGGGGSSFLHDSSPMERHSQGSSEWNNDCHASYRPDRRSEQHCGSHISQPRCHQPAHFEGHTALNSPGPSVTHERSIANRYNPYKFDRGVRVKNTRYPHCTQSQQTECPHVIKKLGSDVVDRFRENQEALRNLVTDLSHINGTFQWKLPDCINVIAKTSDIPEDWCEQVTKKLDRHKHLIEVNLGKGMNPLRDKNESQKPKRLAEGGVDCKEMTKRQIKEQHSDVDLTHTSVTERYRPDVLNRMEKENKEISKEHQSNFYEEVILNVKACQVKVMLKPQVLNMFKEKCKSVALVVDEEKSLVKVRVSTSAFEAKKMKAHVMEFMTKISERNIPLSAAMAKMFTNVQAHGYFQEALDRKGVACCLHLKFNSLSVSANAYHHEQVENILTSLFKEENINLDEGKLASTKSSAWQELVDRLQHRDKERLLPPVVMLDVQKNVVAIVDVHENIARTLSAVKTFFSTNKMQEKIEKIDQNRCRFLHEFCTEELKQLQEQAKERGVSFKISKDGTVTFKGFHDSISVIDKEMKDFLKTIQSQQKTFSGPGVAAYLTSTRGQEYLQHTGHANGCLVTMSTGRVHETSESSDNVLARCRLEQGTELLIIQGDITKCHVDAIVNAANGDLHHAGGVALAIAKAGGKTIEEESRKLVSKYGSLSDGEVVVTGAGQLPCSYVLHAVGPMWQDGEKGEAACLQKTIMNILKMATEKHFSSVAIPSVSCGIFGFPVDRATDIIVRSIVEFSAEHEDMCLQKIILIDMNKKSLRGLLSAAKRYLEKSLTVTGEIQESSHMTPQSSKYKEESSRKSSEKAWEDRRSDPSKDKKSRLPFRIISGELTKSQAEIIVSTVHPSLDLQKGVLSRSVLEHGGHKIQKELQDIFKKRGLAQIGKIVQSSGGDLRCKTMFHLSLPMWRDDKGQVLKSAIRECLESAKKLKAKSIAFPTLGTGKLGYPSDAVASIMYGVIGKWRSDNRDSNLQDVQVVVFSKDRDSLERMRKEKRSHIMLPHKDGVSFHARRSVHGQAVGGRDLTHPPSPQSFDWNRSEQLDFRYLASDLHIVMSSCKYLKKEILPLKMAFQKLEGDSESHGHVAGYRDMDTPSNLKMKVGEMTIIVKEGNILKERCDAIINSSNNSMDLTRGALSKKLLEACGDEIFEEIIKKRSEMEQEGVAATRVPLDRLDCSFIIHISADRFKQDWHRGVLKVLKLADKMNFRSLALPALGTGGLSGEPQNLAHNMQQAIEEFRNQAKSVREIRLVIFQRDMLLHYVNAFKRGTASGHAQDKESMPRGDRSSWSSSQVPLPAWKSVQVLVYSNKIGAAERVLETIDKHIKLNQKTKQEEDRVICRFSPKQRSAVMDLQEKYEVAIDLDTDQGVIKIAGLETNVLKAFAAVKDIKSESNKNQPITTSMMAIRWEYEVDKGKFRSFDPEHIMEIEAAFKKKASTVNLTDKQGRKYQINFKDRKEYSLDNKNLRPIAVRRRDVVQEKSREIPLPNHWQHMSKGDKVKLVDLDPSSSEYKRVLLHFGGQAVKIQRVQNPTLFQQFKVKKKELEMHNPPGTENEQRLWHGTDSKNIDSIITNGFNRSYCGQHGTAYGQGVYFATNSSTSRGYASGGKMFQVRVLVGESTQGNSSLRMPPHKPGQNRPYDSLSGPGMFIIFHDSQAYPEYLITYQ